MRKATRLLLPLAVSAIFLASCPHPVIREVLRYAEDEIPPVITLSSPANRSFLGSSVVFTGTVTDSAYRQSKAERMYSPKALMLTSPPRQKRASFNSNE